MQGKIEIQSVMTLCPHSIGLEQGVAAARTMMQKHGFHHLPVQHGGRLVGVISDRDVKFATGWAKSPAEELSVKDVYIPEPYIVEPTAPLSEVLMRMVKDQVGCALVAIHGDKLVGIFTTTDACRYLGQKLSEKSGCCSSGVA